MRRSSSAENPVTNNPSATTGAARMIDTIFSAKDGPTGAIPSVAPSTVSPNRPPMPKRCDQS